MSDDLVKKFERKGPLATYDLIAALDRNPTIIGAGADICAEAKSTIFAQADRIEELEAKLNFLVQPDSACPHASYRGWVIVDESNGNGTFWYAYTYDWKSGEWDSPHFMMVSGDFDDVTAKIDKRTGGEDELG